MRGRAPLTWVLRPLAGELAPTVAAGMGRQRRLLARSLALVALATAFGVSTAVFTATYAQQAEADARLTNGADVTVTESPGTVVGPAFANRLAAVRGVHGVEPLQHRFAYVGSDLQDLYGVRPRTIAEAGRLQDGWFGGGTATGLMRTLAATPDGVLVSAETVKDFQLHPGDTLRLRIQDGRSKRFMTIPFRYVGVAKEFPTAPKDSFFVANAGYVAKTTRSAAVGAFLVQTTDPVAVASRLRALVGTSAQVTDIVGQRHIVGSGLTAVELSGLTRIELAFALGLALAASGLALAIGLAERRRSFAILAALGARRRPLGAFVWSEALYVTVGGIALGAVLAATITWLLIKVLTGVFDPPPDTAAVPWGYLGAVLARADAAVAAAGSRHAPRAGARRSKNCATCEPSPPPQDCTAHRRLIFGVQPEEREGEPSRAATHRQAAVAYHPRPPGVRLGGWGLGRLHAGHGGPRCTGVPRTPLRDAGVPSLDNNWYGGHYLPGYSLLFPPLAAVLGLRLTGVVLVPPAAYLFARILQRTRSGAHRSAAAWFAAALLGELVIGCLDVSPGDGTRTRHRRASRPPAPVDRRHRGSRNRVRQPRRRGLPAPHRGRAGAPRSTP